MKAASVSAPTNMAVQEIAKAEGSVPSLPMTQCTAGLSSKSIDRFIYKPFEFEILIPDPATERTRLESGEQTVVFLCHLEIQKQLFVTPWGTFANDLIVTFISEKPWAENSRFARTANAIREGTNFGQPKAPRTPFSVNAGVGCFATRGFYLTSHTSHFTFKHKP